MTRPQLGEFVRAARTRAGLSGSDLAAKIARSTTWLYRLESGDRSDPQPADLNEISTACHLTPWEQRYFYLLAGYPPPIDQFGTKPFEYLDLFETPLAWVAGWTADSHFNPEFRRLFKGCDEHALFAQWLFGEAESKRILLNRDAVLDWWVAVGRQVVAQNTYDMGLKGATNLALEIPEYRRRWDQQVIPQDPSGRIWRVYDIDNDVELRLDVRQWRHPYRSGIMLAGFVIGS